MQEPHWTGYVGMATGIIGAITGVAGAIMGYISYRRSSKLKSLDLRLELRKTINELYQNYSKLSELIEYACRSRQAVAAAMGASGSRNMERWKINYEKDKAYLSEVANKLPSTEKSYTGTSPEELESKLVEVHKLQCQLYELTEKYKAGIKADDDNRKFREENMRAQLFPNNKNT